MQLSLQQARGCKTGLTAGDWLVAGTHFLSQSQYTLFVTLFVTIVMQVRALGAVKRAAALVRRSCVDNPFIWLLMVWEHLAISIYEQLLCAYL